MTSKILLCLLVTSSLVRANVIRSCSSSSGDGIAPQTCGTNNTKFYCPVDGLCKPRHQRCILPSVCNNTTTNIEDGCHPNDSEHYNILFGHAKLGILFNGVLLSVFLIISLSSSINSLNTEDLYMNLEKNIKFKS